MLPPCAVASGYEKLACNFPQTVYRSRSGRSPNGKWPIVFKRDAGFTDLSLKVPCGGCLGCKLERSQVWAQRCIHEASLHPNNCFITLTYNNENLPENGSINIKHPQKFMKDLRKKYVKKNPYNLKLAPQTHAYWQFKYGIRFYLCGEYGDKNRRPHYHLILFNHVFKDQIFWQNSNGIPLYRSKELESIWQNGFSSIGEVTHQSAAYVARYILKKITGDCLENPANKFYRHYEQINKTTGLITDLKPEFTNMSRKPGIGRNWYIKNKKDIYNNDTLYIKNRKGKIVPAKIPKYYDDIYDIEYPEEMARIKAKRKQKGIEKSQTPYQLAVSEEIKKSKVQLLLRKYENERILNQRQ